MTTYNRARQSRRHPSEGRYGKRSIVMGEPDERGMLAAKSYNGLPIFIPTGTLDHEIKVSELTKRKADFSIEAAKRYGTHGVAEFFAGFGGLTVEYLHAGLPVRYAIEKDEARADACARNTENDPTVIVVAADSEKPLWFDQEDGSRFDVQTRDCSLLDFDAYSDPVPAMLVQAGPNMLRKGQRVLATTAFPLAWRLHRREESYMRAMAKRFGSPLLRAMKELGGSGIGFSRLVLAPYFERLGVPFVYEAEMEQPPEGVAGVRGSLERVLWKVV